METCIEKDCFNGGTLQFEDNTVLGVERLIPSGIYLIYEEISKIHYVGSSSNLKKRFKNHLSKFKKNKHHCELLQDLYNYGSKLKFIILLYCSEESLIRFEREFTNIKNPICHNEFVPRINPNFNTSGKSELFIGAKNGMYGRKHSMESIELMRKNRSKGYSELTLEQKAEVKLLRKKQMEDRINSGYYSFYFDGKYFLTKNIMANYYGISKRFLKKILSNNISNEEELFSFIRNSRQCVTAIPKREYNTSNWYWKSSPPNSIKFN